MKLYFSLVSFSPHLLVFTVISMFCRSSLWLIDNVCLVLKETDFIFKVFVMSY